MGNGVSTTGEPRPHAYVPDRTAGRDWHGRSFCAVCHLPRANKRHDYTPPPDLGARILGERIDLEEM